MPEIPKDSAEQSGPRPVESSQVVGAEAAPAADCNQFWVTLKMGDDLFALPLERVELSFDPNRKMLVLIEHPA